MYEDEAHSRGPVLAPALGPGNGGGASGAATRAADPLANWEAARQLYESDETIELEVTGYNRGGLLVAFNGLQGFVPSSHLLGISSQLSEEDRKAVMAQKIGQRLRLKVIEYDPTKGRVVFSERAALSGPGSRQQLLTRLAPGDVVEGVITNVCDFGAFVDLGGLEGLIHVSEVSWGRVAHPRDVVACNQHLKVKVLSIDRDQSRVALSLKRLRPDPWANVEDRYTVGQVIDGTVTNVVNFGAFVCVEDGLEGLVHVSELADGHFLHPRNVVHEGERVRARITSIDGLGRRLGLSLRQAELDRDPLFSD
jgi:small subunit ribosomal protein S1